jgi:ABC-2 type transport system ATP-binding protein
MPDSFGSYPEMTIGEYLSFFAACHGVPAADRPSLVTDLLQLVDLGHRRSEPVDRLTRGMKQRLSLARALAHDPQILLLDGPTRGVDPRAHVEMRELIKELRSMGKSIVLTSMTLADLDGLCTHVALLEQGRLVYAGTYADVVTHTHPHRTISVKFFGNTDLAINIARSVHGALEIRLVSTGEAEPDPDEPEELRSTFTVLKELHVVFGGSYSDATEFLRMLMRSGVQVVSFSEHADSPATLLPQLSGDAPPAEAGPLTDQAYIQGER